MTLHDLTGDFSDDLSHTHDRSLEALRMGRLRSPEARALRTGRRRVADAIDSAASRVHAGGERVSRAARTASERITSSASWVREISGQGLREDIGRMVRAHPARTVIGALVVGFLAGRMFRAP